MSAEVRKRILLVEDEALIALAEKNSLEKYGYEVSVLGSGEEAVQAIAAGMDMDLVLMDIDLGSGMDGTQTAERILEMRSLPIVFLSSHTEPEIVERTERITSYGYVVKNSSITVLDASIKMAFKLYEANRKTLESERRQNALIANIADVIVVIDRNGINRYKSPNIRKWFGWEPGDVVGRPALDNVHPDDRAASREILDRLIASEEGTSTSTEIRYLCKDGGYKWIEITLVNMLADPVVQGILGNFHDVSVRKQAEHEKEFERKFTEKLLDSLPGIFYLYSYPELRLVRWNRNHETLLGFEGEEIKNRPIYDWHVPGSEAAVRAAVETAMEEGINDLEAPLVAKDGRLIPFYMTGVPFEMDDRRYLMGIGIDLTGYKKIETELQEIHSRQSALFGAMSEMVVFHEMIYDDLGHPIDYRILDFNEAFTRITGIGRTEAVGVLASEVYGMNPAPYLENYAEVVRTGKPCMYTTFYTPFNKHFSISAVPLGKNQFATVTTDSTRIKEYEEKLQIQLEDYAAVNEELRASTEELQRLNEELVRRTEELDRYFSSSLDLLCIADTDGNFLRLNPEWAKVLGYAIEDLQGKRFLDFVHPEDLDRTMKALSTLSAQKEILNFENRYRHKDGLYRWLEWRSRPQGRLIYAAARDVTPRKRIEEDLRRQVEQKEILLKEVHHRIKNNLAAIEALVFLHGESSQNPEVKAALTDTSGRIASMRVLYEKLLGEKRYAEGSVQDYVGSLVQSMRDALAIPEGVSIRTRVEEISMPPNRLFPLGIIVNEVVTNSIKHAFQGRERGTIDIHLSRNGEQGILEIRDDGPGILPEHLQGGVSGFGLNLVRMLTEQLGGELSIEGSDGTKVVVAFKI